MEFIEADKSHYQGIVAIFNYYIENTNARFESEPFSVADKMEWFDQFNHTSKHRLIVACDGDNVCGFACSQQYRPGKAFEDTVEVTVYTAPDYRGDGLGSMLYNELFSILRSSGVHRALSGIALPNEASVSLHKKFGFSEVGVFHEYAKKNGQYISSIWMQREFTD